MTDISQRSAQALQVSGLVVEFRVKRRDRSSGRQRHRILRAVDGVDLVVHRGEAVALVGESGSGKSTTVQACLGLVGAVAGEIQAGGVAVLSASSRELRALRRHVQMVYQDPYEALDPRFTVRQTVEEPLLIHWPDLDDATRRERVNEALSKVGLTPPELFLARYPHELSGGQRQRVAIASALVLELSLLIADEPTSMLDVSVRADILKILMDLKLDGLGVLMITHDLETASVFADRIVIMYSGRIVETGSARDVIDRPAHPYTQALLSAAATQVDGEVVAAEATMLEIVDPTDLPSGCRYHPRCPFAWERCRREDPQGLLPVPGDSQQAAACWLLDNTNGDIPPPQDVRSSR